MSSSKKSGPLYRITVTFTMNDDGCSVPNLRVTRDESNEAALNGIISKMTANVPQSWGGLSQAQRESVTQQFRMASDGWFELSYMRDLAAYAKARAEFRRKVQELLESVESPMYGEL